MWQFAVENKDLLRTLAAVLGAVVFILDLKRRGGGMLKAWQVRREWRRKEAGDRAFRQHAWYMDAYRRLVVDGQGHRIPEAEFHGLTIQQGCARIGERVLPDCFAGMARRKIGSLN